MNRRTLIVVVGLVLLAGAITLLMRPGPEPPRAAPVAPTTSAPRTVVREPPPPEAPAPEAPKAPARRRATPNPEAAPAPAPAPVEAAPVAGTLHFESDVTGAQVFIDRVFVGATPVTVPNVNPGSHRINISAQGYEGISDTIDVAAGPRDITIKFKEVRLDATLDVVHKHRMGSCQGRLIATPQALRYETTNKNDAFSVGLLDLEAFHVDYLKKNLKVTVRNGKSYDFTDPAGNADHLFVFHRDVEKARERLRKGDSPASD